MMEKLSEFLTEHLTPIAAKLGGNRYLSAIRDGMMGTVGFTIIGSICLLIATFPFPQSYVEWMAAHPVIQNSLFIPYSLTVGIISLYISFGIGYALGKSYKMNELICGCSSVFSFLVLAGGVNGTLGAEGMLSAIISAIVATEIYRICVQKKITIKLPDQVPPAIAGGFTALIPAAITTFLLLVVTQFLGFDINGILSTILAPLFSSAQDTVFMALAYVILATLMWFCGIHPSVLVTLMPGLAIISAENTTAYASGLAIPHIFVNPFYFMFVFIGGQCGTLALNAIMLRAKSKTYRELGKMAFPTSLFNINEPLLFGIPIVYNTTLIIPALIGQILSVFTAYFAFKTGLVPGIGLPDAALWNLPAIIGGTLCTVSWRGGALVVFNAIMQGLIYYPFFKIVDKEMAEKENAGLTEMEAA